MKYKSNATMEDVYMKVVSINNVNEIKQKSQIRKGEMRETESRSFSHKVELNGFKRIVQGLTREL